VTNRPGRTVVASQGRTLKDKGEGRAQVVYSVLKKIKINPPLRRERSDESPRSHSCRQSRPNPKGQGGVGGAQVGYSVIVSKLINK